MIIEYKLDRCQDGKLRTPFWVESGGFLKKEDNTLVGFSPSVREYKIPESVNVLSVAQFKTRAADIHAVTPFLNRDESEMDSSEVENLAQSIIDDNDLS